MPKRPQDHKKPGYGSSWRGQYKDLELPSGELCRVKRPGVQGLMKAGILHSLDSLTSIVSSETIPQAEGRPKVDISKVAADPEKFDEMMAMVDKVVCYVVVEPKVLPVRVPDDDADLGDDGAVVMRDITDDERDPDAIYADYIDPQDKMFIMNYAVGGSADLVRFRQESEALVGSLSTGTADKDASQ